MHSQKSIFENVIFGIRQHGNHSKSDLYDIAESQLKAVSLWREVSDRLDNQATTLSIGQQQRLCIARTLAMSPDVLLMDEPTSALDHRSAAAIEELVRKLKERYCIIFVTHNIEQASRIADDLIFLCDGTVIEQGPAEKLFNNPDCQETRNYITKNQCDC